MAQLAREVILGSTSELTDNQAFTAQVLQLHAKIGVYNAPLHSSSAVAEAVGPPGLHACPISMSTIARAGSERLCRKPQFLQACKPRVSDGCRGMGLRFARTHD